MKTVCIVYGQPLTQVQGVNFVNSSFVEGQKYFFANGLKLKTIFAPDQEFDCSNQLYLNTIGANRGSASYLRERKLRKFLSRCLSSEHLFGACVKFYFNYYRNAQRAISRLMDKIDEYDYLIFQDVFTAKLYFDKVMSENQIKTVLILHCSNHPLEQFRESFKGLFKHKYIGNKIESLVDVTIREVNKVIFLSKHAMDKSPLSKDLKTFVYNGKEDIEGLQVADVSYPLNFVLVASAIFHKGHHLLIKALSLLDRDILQGIHLHIIGDGTDLEVFKNLAYDLKVEDFITFYGNRNDVSELLSEMDVFILPSLSEGMPMSIIEAMRQGLYIMATPVGGIPEMIHPSFGILFNRNVKSIADAITYVVSNKVVTYEKKFASRKFYEEKFNLRGMIDKYSVVLKSL